MKRLLRHLPIPGQREQNLAPLGQVIIAVGAWLIALACLAVPARADYPAAPDVVVFCEPTLQHVLTDIARLWRSESGVRVRIFTSPTPPLLAQIAHHARDDIIVGEGEANAAAAENQQLITPATLRHFGRNRLVIAALNRTPATAAGARHGTGRLSAIAGKEPIAIVDPWATTAGAGSRQALQSLGLWQQVGAKSMGVPSTSDAVYLLTERKVRFAIVYATDIAADPEFTIIDQLPPTSYRPVVYWVAQAAHALSPNAVKFVEFLSTAAARERLTAGGLEVSP